MKSVDASLGGGGGVAGAGVRMGGRGRGVGGVTSSSSSTTRPWRIRAPRSIFISLGSSSSPSGTAWRMSSLSPRAAMIAWSMSSEAATYTLQRLVELEAQLVHEGQVRGVLHCHMEPLVLALALQLEGDDAVLGLEVHRDERGDPGGISGSSTKGISNCWARTRASCLGEIDPHGRP